MSYTPTTWTTGDTITAAAMNKIEQGIAAGGGAPTVVTVSGNETSLTTVLTYNQIKASFNAGLVIFDFTGATGWSGKMMMVSYDDSQTDVTVIGRTGTLVMYATSADSPLLWAD